MTADDAKTLQVGERLKHVEGHSFAEVLAKQDRGAVIVPLLNSTTGLRAESHRKLMEWAEIARWFNRAQTPMPQDAQPAEVER